MEQSAARGFFRANKDLFQYDKYIANQDPFQCEDENGQADGEKSFLEQYRDLECDRPPLSTYPELRFSLLHPPTRKYSVSTLAVNTTTLLPDFVTLQSTEPILRKLADTQPPSSSLANSPQWRSHLVQPQHRLMEAMLDSALPQQYASPATINNGSIESHPLQQQRSPVRLPVMLMEAGPKPKSFCLPELADLLIDRETRAAVTAHKSWDEAHKIEVLVGGKCVGRVSAASRNIPQSIRLRLRASATVSVRRERLYELLRRDYDELSKRNGQ